MLWIWEVCLHLEKSTTDLVQNKVPISDIIRISKHFLKNSHWKKKHRFHGILHSLQWSMSDISNCEWSNSSAHHYFLRYIRKRRKKGLLGIYFTFEYFSLFLILPTKKFNEGKKNSNRTFPLYQACRKAELFKNPLFAFFSVWPNFIKKPRK